MQLQKNNYGTLPGSMTEITKELTKCLIFMDYHVEDPKQLIEMSKMICETFSEYDSKTIIDGIRAGYTGQFGRSYKMTLQEICIWIRCHQEMKKPRDYERSDNLL